MPTQTMAGGDDADIDGAPPVDDEAIVKTESAVACRMEMPGETRNYSQKCLEMRLGEVVKSLAGRNFGSRKDFSGFSDKELPRLLPH